MSERLAADENFQEFAIHSVQLLAKIQSVKRINFFREIASKGSLEAVATTRFLTESGFESVQSIRDGFSYVAVLFNKISSSFPEIANNSIKDYEFVNAFQLLQKNQKIEERLKVNGKIPAAICWAIYVVCTANCFMQFGDNFELYVECMAACSSAVGLCYLFAD